MTPGGPSRSPSPFFAGHSSPPPIPDDLDDMLLDALHQLPEPASRAEIGAWLEANYDCFDHQAHSFELARRLRANVERGLLSVASPSGDRRCRSLNAFVSQMERRYRFRAPESDTRNQLKRSCSTERSGMQASSLQRKRRTVLEKERDPNSELYSSDASMDDGQNDDSVTPS